MEKKFLKKLKTKNVLFDLLNESVLTQAFPGPACLSKHHFEALKIVFHEKWRKTLGIVWPI
jgi:hypothetical protein